MQYLAKQLTLCPHCPARKPARLRELLHQRHSFHLSVQQEAAAGTGRSLAPWAELHALYNDVVRLLSVEPVTAVFTCKVIAERQTHRLKPAADRSTCLTSGMEWGGLGLVGGEVEQRETWQHAPF